MRKNQVLPASAYVWISLGCVLTGVALLLFFVYKVEDLVNHGIDNKVFYILLFPMGFSAAAFLFGVMRSYARYKGKILSGVLELGGPVVLFVLVIIGGFQLVPENIKPFNYTIFLRDEDGTSISLKRGVEGQVQLTVGDEVRRIPIDETGAVFFKNIPPNFKGQNARVQLNAWGWLFENGKPAAECRLNNDNSSLIVWRDPESLRISCRIIDGTNGNPIEGVKVTAGGCTEQTQTGKDGQFVLIFDPHNTKIKRWESIELVCVKEGYEIFTTSVEPGNLTDCRISLSENKGKEKRSSK